MKTSKMKLAVVAGLSIICSASFAQNTFPDNGNVGIGINSDVPSLLTVFNTSSLPMGALGTWAPGYISPSRIVSSLGGGTTMNGFYGSLWLRRNAYGNDWTTTSLHDGIRVDGSFGTPGLDTRTWYERSPFTQKHTWGDLALTFMTLQKGKLGIGNSGEPVELLQLGDRFVFHNGTTKYLGYNMKTNTSNGLERIVSDYASRIAFGSGDISMELYSNAAAGSACASGTANSFTIKNNGNINSSSAVAAKMSLASQSSTLGSLYWTSNAANSGIGIGLDYQSNTLKTGIFDQFGGSTPTLMIGVRRSTGGVAQMYLGDISATSLNTSNTRFTVMSTAALPNAIDVIDNATQTVKFRVKNDGKVYAKEMILTMDNFPDYVFDSKYRLAPLSEVEAFIQKNHHLPNMPSAKTVEENGANMGEIQRVSVEKIEELYQYVIQLEKQVKELQEQVKEKE